MLERISPFLAHSVLGVPKNTLFARYQKIFSSFFLSAIYHIALDYGLTVPMHEAGSIQFFLLQALGIVIEDGFQAAYYSLTGRSRPLVAPLLHKLFGYMWVIAFMTWSLPVWTYPQMRYVRGRTDAMYPFTIFGPARAM